MKIHNHILTIAIALLVSMPSYAVEPPESTNLEEFIEETEGGSEEFETEDDSSEESETEDDSSEESENDLGDLDEPVSESDIGDSIDTSDLEPDVVIEPVYFDDSLGFDDNDEEQVLATPIPAAIWLFATGLLGLSNRVKRQKKFVSA